MNRRQFLAYLPLPFLPVSVLANGDDEVGIPVEPCPCCCTDDGITWYSCDEAGVALPGDPAGCDALNMPPLTVTSDKTRYIVTVPQDSDEPLPVDGATDNDVSQVVQLPSTGSGSSLCSNIPGWHMTEFGDWCLDDNGIIHWVSASGDIWSVELTDFLQVRRGA
jgi:hypothetical protein